MSLADRGKVAEGKVAKYFDSLNGRILGFWAEKLPDARSAGGRLKAVLCDFLVCCNEKPFAIEVKETEHDFRLQSAKIDQLPRLRKARYSGMRCIVLVYHSTLKVWRAAGLDYFDGEIPSSWDLRDLPTFKTPEEALNSLQSWTAFIH